MNKLKNNQIDMCQNKKMKFQVTQASPQIMSKPNK